MKEVYLISCFKKKLKKLDYYDGDEFVLPFRGVFNGQLIENIKITSGINFSVPMGGAVCLCNILIINVEKKRIVGKLESIDFL